MSDLDHTHYKPVSAPIIVGLKPIDSVALARLVEEVRNTGESYRADVTAYNRTYHRHNR